MHTYLWPIQFFNQWFLPLICIITSDLLCVLFTVVWVIAWCCQTTSHYLTQCWLRSVWPYDITRPQWVKFLWANIPLLGVSSGCCSVWHCDWLYPIYSGLVILSGSLPFWFTSFGRFLCKSFSLPYKWPLSSDWYVTATCGTMSMLGFTWVLIYIL